MLERHGKDRRPSAAYERLRTAARHGSNQALGDSDGRDAGASAVPESIAAADRDVAALRVVRDLYQSAPDLGEDGPVRRHVRKRGIGEWREAVEQVADANRVGPIGQSGGNAGACACLGDRRRPAALPETREERIEGGEPLLGPVTSTRVAKRQMRVKPSDLEALHGGQLIEEAFGRLERHAQPPQSGIDLDVDRNRFPRRRCPRRGFGAGPVNHRRHQSGADEIGHPRRQCAREHDDRRAEPLRAQAAGLVEGAGHERHQPFPVERAGHGHRPVPVGVALERGDASLMGPDATANLSEVRA